MSDYLNKSIMGMGGNCWELGWLSLMAHKKESRYCPTVERPKETKYPCTRKTLGVLKVQGSSLSNRESYSTKSANLRYLGIRKSSRKQPNPESQRIGLDLATTSSIPIKGGRIPSKRGSRSLPKTNVSFISPLCPL